MLTEALLLYLYLGKIFDSFFSVSIQHHNNNGTLKNAPLQNKCHWQLLICYILYHVICHNLPIFFCNNKFDDSRVLSLLNGEQHTSPIYVKDHSIRRSWWFLCVPLSLLLDKGLHFLIDPYLVCDLETIYYGRCNNQSAWRPNSKVVVGTMSW